MISQQDIQAFEQPLEKHRLERQDYSIDFQDNLDVGETLVSIDSVEVYSSSCPPVDLSAEFSPSNAQVVVGGSSAAFRLAVASSGQQDGSEPYYILRMQATTSAGRVLQTSHALYVSEQGDPSAP